MMASVETALMGCRCGEISFAACADDESIYFDSYKMCTKYKLTIKDDRIFQMVQI